MKSINSLANIARSYGIEPTANKLRDDIVSEYTDMIDSLSFVDESVIVKDIALLPVYTINEAIFGKNKLSDEDVKKIESLFSKELKIVVNEYNTKKKNKIRKAIDDHIKWSYGDYDEDEKSGIIKDEFSPYDKQIPVLKFELHDEIERGYVTFDFGNYYSQELCSALEPIIKEIGEDLKTRKAVKDLITKISTFSETTGQLGVYYDSKKCKKYLNESSIEGYAIDLDTLKYVVETKEITIQEAIQEIRDVNYIGDTIPMYCVLPGNINENISLESFINLTESLNKYEITPISIREFSDIEFVNEALTIEKMKEPQVRKTLEKYEKNLEELKKKKEEFEKMPPAEQKKYCVNKTIKNVLTSTGIGLVTFGVGSYVYTTQMTMKGDNTSLGPKMYIKALNNLITAYNNDIKRLNKRLAELEKESKK